MLTPIASWRNNGESIRENYEALDRFRGRLVGAFELGNFVFMLVAVLRQLRDSSDSFAPMSSLRFTGLGPERVQFFKDLVDSAAKEFSEFELDAALDRIKKLRIMVDANASLGDIVKEIRIVTEVAEDQLTRRHSVYVPLKKYDYYFKIGDLFPEPIQVAFPSAENEAIAACRAYSLDLNTACVFHAMGIVQCGLYALAHQLQISFTTSTETSVELENWKNIIDQIESRIKDLEGLKRGREKDKQLSFYSRAAMQFRYFKDAWRNHVDHNREEYDADQAHSILIHARDFIKELAEHGLHDPS